MTKQKSKGAGGKLARSEIIQARLSTKIKFAVEILARMEKRTVSSLIETLIDEASATRTLKVFTRSDELIESVPVRNFVHDIWQCGDDMLQFIALACAQPELLTDEEEKWWSLISKTPYFWKCVEVMLLDENDNEIGREWEPLRALECLIEKNLREYWSDLKGGKLTKNDLPAGDQVGEKIICKDKPMLQKKVDFKSFLKQLKKISKNNRDKDVLEAIAVLEKYGQHNDGKNFHEIFGDKYGSTDFLVSYTPAKSHDD